MFALSDRPPTLEELAELRREIDALEARWVRMVGAYDRAQGWAADGFVNAGSALRDACRMTPGNASATVHLARKLEQLPATAAAFGRGEISRQHAGSIADAYTSERAREMGDIEAQLVEIARHTQPRELRGIVRRYTDALDGDGGTEADERAFAKRRLHLSKTLDAMGILDGALHPEGTEIVATALHAEMERDHVRGDTRTRQQRRADALINLCRRALDAGMVGGSRTARPHLLIKIDLKELEDRAPELVADARIEAAHVGHLSRATLQRLSRDCDITRIITHGPSEILDVGRATRTVTAAQWKALIVRDRHCQAPGCDRPPGWCEAHHIIHWEHDGPTDLDNLVLLCWHHHRAQHVHDARAGPSRE